MQPIRMGLPTSAVNRFVSNAPDLAVMQAEIGQIACAELGKLADGATVGEVLRQTLRCGIDGLDQIRSERRETVLTCADQMCHVRILAVLFDCGGNHVSPPFVELKIANFCGCTIASRAMLPCRKCMDKN